MFHFVFHVLLCLLPAAITGARVDVDVDVSMFDLTHTITVNSPVPPWWPPYNFTKILKQTISPGVVAEGNAFSTAEHSGTHIDAPKHFCQNAATVDEISVDKLTGPGAVVRLRHKAKENRDYQITVDDLQGWESVNGEIPRGAILLFDLGWDKFWPNMTQIYNSETMKLDTLHYPGVKPEAAKWLTSNRKLHAIGIDTPSIDYGQTTLYESHVEFCSHGVVIIENVANLGKLPPIGTQIFVGALKLGNGTGTPSRIFAVVKSSSGAADTKCHNLISFVLVFIPLFLNTID